MRDLTHRSRAFRGIRSEEQQRLVIEAVKIINRRISAGFAVSCNIREVELLSPKWIRGFRHAYALCCHLSMVAVGNFLSKTGSADRVNYVFESGHPHEAEARDFMRHAVQNSDIRRAIGIPVMHF